MDKQGRKTNAELDRFVQSIEAEIMEDYTPLVIDHAYNPRNFGVLENSEAMAKVTGACGDTIQIHLKIEDDKIIDAKFLTDGCGTTIACASIVSELAKDKTLADALKINKDYLLEYMGGLPPENEHCALLAANTLRVAIEFYTNSKNGTKKEKNLIKKDVSI